MKLKSALKRVMVSESLERHIDRIGKPVGSLGYDPWGFNMDSLKVGAALFKFLYDHYFRVECHGVENVPKDGPALIIGNHSGQLPLDGTMIAIAVAMRKENPRVVRTMIERFFPTVPFLGNLMNAVGAVIGDPVNCAKMLQNGEPIIVFPEGIRGSGKPYSERYHLKRFGNGFLHLAMQHNAPVIPVGVVGCEETIPALGNIAPLARLFGVPYVPVALPVVFPAKVVLNFGEPLYFKNDTRSDKEVERRVESVKAAISDLVDKGLSERKRIF